MNLPLNYIEGTGKYANHIRITRVIPHPYGEDLEDFIDYLRELAIDLVDPEVDSEHVFGYGGDDDRNFNIIGWRPMTDKEIADRDNRAKAERALKRAAKKAKEVKDKETLKKLIEKYGIPDE